MRYIKPITKSDWVLPSAAQEIQAPCLDLEGKELVVCRISAWIFVAKGGRF